MTNHTNISQHDQTEAGRSTLLWKFLHSQVDSRTHHEGRTDSPMLGLRYYRFSSPMEYLKNQRLSPGLVVVVQGHKTAKIQGRSHQYSAGQSLLLAREVLCAGTIIKADAESPYLALHIDLPPAMLVRTILAVAGHADYSDLSVQQDACVFNVDDQLLEALCRLLPATDSELDRLTLTPLILEEIIVRLIRSESAWAIRSILAISRTALRIQESMQYIQTHFREKLTVERLAQRVAMSSSHYAHCFRQVGGVSPMRYLRDVRLGEASVLLVAKTLRANEVAAHIGFQSDAHFSREFKRRFEYSPAQYAVRMSPKASV
jgi:AraC-like DNA-binding protein